VSQRPIRTASAAPADRTHSLGSALTETESDAKIIVVAADTVTLIRIVGGATWE
jgi:hypothetical protein